MNMSRQLSAVFLVVFLVAIWQGLSGCGTTGLGGSEVGNPAGVALKITGFSRDAVATKTLTNGITLTSAHIVLSEIRFRPLAVCLSAIEEQVDDIDFRGPFVTDLLGNQTFPAIGSTNLAADTYCRIRIKLDRLGTGELPPEFSDQTALIGNSIVIEGRRSDDVSFRFIYDRDDDFRLENRSSGFEIGLANHLFFVATDFEQWFADINLDNAAIENGAITIDDQSNRALGDQLTSNIKKSFRLFKDGNNDGQLGSDEDNGEDELATGEDI